MIVTTPAGSLVIVVSNGGPAMCSAWSSSGAYWAAWWKRPAKTFRSIAASNRILPFSRDRISARSSASASSPSSALSTIAVRSAADSAAQAGQAGSAAATASSASSADAAAAWPMTVAGVRRVVDGKGAGRALTFLAVDKQWGGDHG